MLFHHPRTHMGESCVTRPNESLGRSEANCTRVDTQPGASPRISGWGVGGGRISAVSFGSDQWNDMCFYGTDNKY